MEMKPEFAAARKFNDPPPELLQSITDNFRLQLRGKSLLQAFVSVMQQRDNEKVKHNGKAILDICMRFFPGNQYIARLVQAAKYAFESANQNKDAVSESP